MGRIRVKCNLAWKRKPHILRHFVAGVSVRNLHEKECYVVISWLYMRRYHRCSEKKRSRPFHVAHDVASK